VLTYRWSHQTRFVVRYVEQIGVNSVYKLVIEPNLAEVVWIRSLHLHTLIYPS
jgi:hypothetical protein